MNGPPGDVFLVPFEDRMLLHAPLHGVTSLLNRRAAADLQSYLAGDGAGCQSPAVRALGRTLQESPPAQPAVRRGPFAPASVSLLPTNDCNLRCLYCAPSAGEGDRSHMSRETCDAALGFYAGVVRREGLRRFAVNFFGGEPLLSWEGVQYALAQSRSLAEALGVPLYATCTTNAFLPEERARWLARRLSFVLVSMDGPPDVQDRFRPTRSGGRTHDAVARSLRIFREEGLPFALRCSVESGIVERVAEVVGYLCREFRPRAIDLEPLVAQGRCLQTGLHPPTAARFVTEVVAAGKVARAHGVELKLFTAQTELLTQSPCGVSEDSFVVCPDGLVTSCYSANSRQSPYAGEYAIGEVDVAAGTVRVDPLRLERVRSYRVANIPRCARCFARWHCAGGCRLFHTPPFCAEPENAMCALTQRLTLWSLLGRLGLCDEADRVGLELQEVAGG